MYILKMRCELQVSITAKDKKKKENQNAHLVGENRREIN